MSRELLLLRHGKSEWGLDVDDFERPLKKRGKRSAQRMGAWLRQQDLIPDYILSSPAVRALNTAEKLTKAMGLTAKHVHYDPRIYAAELSDLKAVLADCPESLERIMLVGHNPGFEELLVYLAKDSVPEFDDGKLLPTATMALLTMPNDWHSLSRGCADILSVTRPADLPKSFPFKGLIRMEYRPRPAYYYSQSAAVPYRIKKGGLQILLISSSGNNHWSIPKGIIEPGSSASASAEIQAWEEAGIKGVMSQEMLGCYPHKKWGGTCIVQVFPMLVTDMENDEEWGESHRTRKWVSLKKAGSMIENKALQAMFVSLAANFAKKSG